VNSVDVDHALMMREGALLVGSEGRESPWPLPRLPTMREYYLDFDVNNLLEGG